MNSRILSGTYLLEIRLEKKIKDLRIGALGLLSFEPGKYFYVGSAMRNLFSRVGRHIRRGVKKKHWHIDYFLEKARVSQVAFILSRNRFECHLASFLSKHLAAVLPGFGASDCSCPSHLFYLSGKPGELLISSRILVEKFLSLSDCIFEKVDPLPFPVESVNINSSFFKISSKSSSKNFSSAPAIRAGKDFLFLEGDLD